PPLIYLVSFNYSHMAVGAMALSVAANTFVDIIPHARRDFDLKTWLVFSSVGGGRGVARQSSGYTCFLLGGTLLFVAVFPVNIWG
ncbi:MAG: hypothetical protein ABWJ42_03625, partial [Sulfolobales archaeon]